MTKLLFLLKKYSVLTVVAAAIGGMAIFSVSDDGIIGAGDGKKLTNDNSINDLLRNGQKKSKKKSKSDAPSDERPSSDEQGLGDENLEVVLTPPVIDEALLDEYNEERCQSNNSTQGSTTFTTGQIQSVRFIDMNHFYAENEYAPVECLISILADGCIEASFYSVVASKAPGSRYSGVSKNLCEAAEKAMLDKHPVTLRGAKITVNGVTPNGMINKLLTFEIGR